MLTLYVHPDREDGAELRQELLDRSLRFEERETGYDREPRLVDANLDATGTREIYQALEELDAYTAEWYKFQSDACFIDNDGSVC